MSSTDRPYAPISVGLYLLAAPLLAAAIFASTRAEVWADLSMGLVLAVIGLTLQGRRGR